MPYHTIIRISALICRLCRADSNSCYL